MKTNNNLTKRQNPRGREGAALSRNNYLKKFSQNFFYTFLSILIISIISFFSLTSAGWHYADEIASGTFRGVYVFNDSVVFEKAVVIKGQTTIEQTNEIRPYVENGFNLTFTKENETKQVTLSGELFQPGMEILNLPEGYTQSIEINSPYEAVIDITNSDFNSTLTDLTFSNHFPEEIKMQVETIIKSNKKYTSAGVLCQFSDDKSECLDSYIVNTDTIEDTILDLTWQKNPPTTTYTWANAVSYCENLNLDGKTNWELPTLVEMELSLIDTSRSSSPYIVGGTSYFPTIQNNWYWTNTRYSSSNAYYVSFDYGRSSNAGTSSSFYVLCVSRNS